MHPIIALWAVPRSVSTAFERMMASRGDFTVLNEPFSGYYYFGPERINTRYPKRRGHDFDTILHSIVTAARHGPVFFKDMAYHISARRDRAFLKEFRNTFLIRHPKLSLPSLFRKLPDFTPEETGYERLYELFEEVTELQGSPPAVLDGEALRSDPEGTARAWCEAVGIDFKAESLHWKAGHDRRWRHWGHWFAEAAASTGFRPPIPEKDSGLLRKEPLARAYARCLPIYEKLSRFALRPRRPLAES